MSILKRYFKYAGLVSCKKQNGINRRKAFFMVVKGLHLKCDPLKRIRFQIRPFRKVSMNEA